MDLIIIIGTSGVAWPAASYIEQVIMRGGKVALFDIERPDPREFPSDGWVFIGDAAEVLPKVLEPIIGSRNIQVSTFKETYSQRFAFKNLHIILFFCYLFMYCTIAVFF